MNATTIMLYTIALFVVIFLGGLMIASRKEPQFKPNRSIRRHETEAEILTEFEESREEK